MPVLDVSIPGSRTQVVDAAVIHVQDNGDVAYFYFGRHQCHIRITKADGTTVKGRDVGYEEVVETLLSRGNKDG